MKHTVLNRMWERVITVIRKPAGESRGDIEIDMLLPWLKKRSELLSGCEKDVLMEILRFCTHREAVENEVIIRQGEIGDSFYIMLTGRSTVYIDPSLTGEEEREDGKQQEEDSQPDVDEPRVLSDRSVLGKPILSYDPGKSFGEVALISESAKRNASIIADEPTDLLVIHRALFNRCLKERQEAEYAAREAFIHHSSLFSSWSARFKHLLQLALRRQRVPAGCHVTVQGQRTDGIGFMLSGQARVVLEPARYRTQFPALSKPPPEQAHPMEQFISKYRSKKQSPERQQSARSRSSVNGRKENEETLQKLDKFVELCQIQQEEVVGDIEAALGLETHIYHIIATSPCDLFWIDVRNVTRLVKKHMKTYQDLVLQARTKLLSRSQMPAAKHVPFLQNLHSEIEKRFGHNDLHRQQRPTPTEDLYLKKLQTLFVHERLPFIAPIDDNLVNSLHRIHLQNAKHRENDRRRIRETVSQYNEKRRDEQRLSRANKRPFQQRRNHASVQIKRLSEFTDCKQLNETFVTSLKRALPTLKNKDDCNGFDLQPTQRRLADSPNSAPLDASGSLVVPANERSLSAPLCEGDAFDPETSDHVLHGLEDRIRRFQQRTANTAARAADTSSTNEAVKPLKLRVSSLRRFRVQGGDVPMQGGTVLIRSSTCHFRLEAQADAGQRSSNHRHVRRRVLPQRAGKCLRELVQSAGPKYRSHDFLQSSSGEKIRSSSARNM